MDISEIRNVEDILALIQETLAANTDIEYYSQQKYSKSCRVFVGIDEDNPPKQEDYPVIIIFSVNRAERGESSKFVVYEAVIGVGVVNESCVVDGKKTTYIGMAEAERLRELVEAALFGKVAHKTDVQGQTSSEIIFPLFRSDTVIKLSFIQTSQSGIK